MSGNKKSSDRVAAQPEEAAVTMEPTEETTTNHSTTQRVVVARYLKNGSENATRTVDLMKLTDIKEVRDLRERIERERMDGVPILTKGGKGGGYFLPSADAGKAIVEIEAFISLQTAKGIGCLRSMEPAKKLLRELKQKTSGQQKMEM